MTTYEVGTTAKFRSYYRERRQDGEWYDDIGCHMSAFGDDTARDLYTDITPPGPPLPAGTVLDPGKRYTLQSDPGDDIRILQSESGAWRDVTSYCIQWVVLDHEIVREIREPGSADQQESRPEWDAVKGPASWSAYMASDAGQLEHACERIATAEAEADEARAECTRLNDGWDNTAELLSVANDEACELQKTAENWKQSFENARLLREAGRTKHIAEMNKNDQDRANWWKEREELKTRLNESERLRKQHWTDLLVAEAEGRKSLEEDKESERVREAQQSQIRALEAKVLTRETALKAAQAEISRGLQKTRTDKAEAAGYLYTGRFLSKDNIWYARYDRPAPPVDETVAGYFTD